MRAVWKYPIPFPPTSDNFSISMPGGAKPLTVQLQYGEPEMWALVDPQEPTVVRDFRIAGTGHSLPDALAYIGTFQVASGQLVFHVFEVTTP